MKRYEICLGILDNSFNFSSFIIEADNKVEAVKEFFNQLIDEIKDLDYEQIAENDDGWIYGEIEE